MRVKTSITLAEETLHAVDRIAALDQRRRVGMPANHRERAGIQRVAAEFVTGKPRPIEDADAQAGRRENRGRQRTGRPGSRNGHVIHLPDR